MPSRLAALRRLALGLQAVAFLVMASVIWLDEYLDLPHRFFGASATPFRPEESGFETTLLAVVAAISLLVTASLFRRLAHALSFLAYCPSCQRVRSGDEWTTLSEFLQRDQGETLSYGLCPDCDLTARPGARLQPHPPDPVRTTSRPRPAGR